MRIHSDNNDGYEFARPLRTMRFPGYETKEQYLYCFFNRFGHEELAICFNYVKDGEMRWSKWVKYKDLLGYDDDQYIKGFYKMTKKQFIQKCTHRTIAPCEIVFDVDDLSFNGLKDVNGKPLEIFGSILGKADFIHRELVSMGYEPMVAFTQSKSVHLHVIDLRLNDLDSRSRTKFKQDLLDGFGCDVQKGTDRCMISMLGSKHYKSGKKKILLKWR